MSESLQWAVLTPVIVLATLGVVQVGVLSYARSAVREAAATGAEMLAVTDDATQAVTVARRIAAQADLRDVDVVVQRTGNDVLVEVSARVNTFVKIGPTDVHASASQRWERPQ